MTTGPDRMPTSRLTWLAYRLRPIAVFFLIGLVIFGVSRLGLAAWHAAQVSAVDGWGMVFVQGLRVDIASLCMLYGLPAVAALLMPGTGWIARYWRYFLQVWLTLVTCLLVFFELSTFGFMEEYGLRPNRIFLEYLGYPQEISSTLIKGHLLSVVLGLLVVPFVALATWRLAGRLLSPARLQGHAGLVLRVPAAVALLLVAALGARSTLGHRPLNPAMVAFTTDATVNVLPLNTFYSLAHAERELLQEHDTARLYGEMSLQDVVRVVRAHGGLAEGAYASNTLPTLAARQPHYTGRPRNLVIILEESLGAQFIGSLGGLPLSPNIDRLSRQGWAFDNLYATGTRSVRGIEAVLTGFTPTPAQAVVKMPKSQHGFFTLADLLSRRGYDATFYYGGESHFDSMNGFFLGNGFTRIIDQGDYVDPVFTGSWGVSDEDLFSRADAEFKALHAKGKPFFGLVFSSSNHDPFEFPDGRIALHEQPKQTRNNAAKYADHAVGTFFDKAMAAPYWKDTVFLVVADHDSRAFGHDLVPIHNFHIPGFILGAGVTPRRDSRLVSQIDLGPTLLSLIGIGDATPMIGQDLTDPGRLNPGRAMMQYDLNFAWRVGNDVVILQPEKPAAGFRYDPATDVLTPAPVSADMKRAALAHALWGTYSYEQRLHRLPTRAAESEAGRPAQ